MKIEGPGKVLDRARQARWDRRNLRTVSTHLTVQEAEKLKRICREAGIARYHLIRWFLLSLIRKPEALGRAIAAIRRDGF